MSTETQIATRPKASQLLAQSLGMEPGAMLDAIKAQCFRCNPANVTNEMLAAFVSVAAAMDVNPFLPDMLYAFPGAGGSIVPIMGPSGVYKKLMEHPDVDSWETVVYPEDVSVPPTHAVTKIWRKGRERPLSYTALLSEWKINSNPQWSTRPRHFLALRSLKHAARQIIHGLPYDADDRHIMEEINVTNTGAQEQSEAPPRPAPPPRSKKGAAAVVENKPAIDVQATAAPATPPTPSGEAGVVKATPPIAVTGAAATAEAAPASPVAPAPATNGNEPRAFLKDGEEITTVCTVAEVTPLMMAMRPAGGGEPETKPSVKVILKGGYNGEASHHGGGTGTPPEMGWSPLWEPGNTVKVRLMGKLQPMPTDPKKVTKYSGKVVVRVMDVQQEGQPVSPVEAVD